MRAAYMAQELLTTFADEIGAVTLKPSEEGGRYTIYIEEEIVFDRKTHGGFPEIKEIKRMIRDVVNPEKSLGHTDR